MSIDRLISCLCGHSVDEHDGDGCRRHAPALAAQRTCACARNRVEAIDSVIAVERSAIDDRWKSRQANPRA